MLKQLGIALPVALVALLTLACSSGRGAAPSVSPEGNAAGKTEQGVDRTVVGEAGGVTVEATWLTERDKGSVEVDLSRYPLKEFVLLNIQFTTHAGDLGRIDMVQAALLKQSQGETRPEAWVSLSDDAHHRAGVLIFRRQPGDGSVDMVLSTGDGEVVLRWQTAPTP